MFYYVAIGKMPRFFAPSSDLCFPYRDPSDTVFSQRGILSDFISFCMITQYFLFVKYFFNFSANISSHRNKMAKMQKRKALTCPSLFRSDHVPSICAMLPREQIRASLLFNVVRIGDYAALILGILVILCPNVQLGRIGSYAILRK